MPTIQPHGPSRRARHVLATNLMVTLTWIGVGRPAAAQPTPSAPLAPRAISARRVQGSPPTIDGRLDDAAWVGAPSATDFILSRPRPGGVPTLPTEARVVFDDAALYVAVRAYDPRPDSILAPYPRRDDEITSDWLFVELDSRHDRRSGFSFGLNPRGVQVDGTWANDGDYDAAWNGVWSGAARIDSLGWSAEFRIPFAQLALPSRSDASAVFGLNVYRFAPHRGEVANWSPRLPSLTGVVSHFNELRGVVLPNAAHRLQLLPYVATRTARADVRPGDAASASLPRGSSLTAGLDARLRVTPSLALSGTVRPDFGQVEADPAVVNLTAFETFFPEQRPFFIDAADRFVFNAVASAVPGQAGLAGFGVGFQTRDVSLSEDTPFYSRRIGRPPHLDALAGLDVREVPAVTDILGAAKLVGRTEHGWSLGVLSAVTGRASARVRTAPDVGAARDTMVLLEPRTGYAVARIARDTHRGQTTVGGLLTVVEHDGVTDGGVPVGAAALGAWFPRTAVVAATDARHRFGGSAGRAAYELSGFVAASQVRGPPAAIRGILGDAAHGLLRPDAAHLARFRDDTARTELDGASAQLRLAKPAGHWLWSVTGHAVGPGFASNEVGFGRNTDWLLAVGTLTYQAYQPGRLFRRWSVGLDQAGAGWSTGGERRGAVASLRATGELRNDWGAGIGVARELAALSMDALRGGPALLLPGRTTWRANVHSNARRATQWNVQASRTRDDGSDGGVTAVLGAIDARLADRVRVRLQPSVSHQRDPWHFVGSVVARDSGVDACRAAPRSTRCFVVGRLTQTTATVTGRADLALTSHATLQLYAQPLVGSARFERFAAVVAPRASDPAGRTTPLAGPLPPSIAAPSFSTRQVLGTAVWRWEYRPGSTLFLVATQRRAGDDPDARWDPLGAVRTLTRDPSTTVLQAKLSYWWQP